MKRYRYGDPALSGFRKWGSVVYFVLTWNVFGYVAYKLYGYKKGKDNAEWNQMSATQKYMSMVNIPEKNVETVKISGFSVKKPSDENE